MLSSVTWPQTTTCLQQSVWLSDTQRNEESHLQSTFLLVFTLIGRETLDEINNNWSVTCKQCLVQQHSNSFVQMHACSTNQPCNYEEDNKAPANSCACTFITIANSWHGNLKTNITWNKATGDSHNALTHAYHSKVDTRQVCNILSTIFVPGISIVFDLYTNTKIPTHMPMWPNITPTYHMDKPSSCKPETEEVDPCNEQLQHRSTTVQYTVTLTQHKCMHIDLYPDLMIPVMRMISLNWTNLNRRINRKPRNKQIVHQRPRNAQLWLAHLAKCDSWQ